MADRRFLGKGILVAALQDQLGLSRRKAARMVDIVVRIMKDNLMVGHSVKIPGLGTLEVVEQKFRRRKIGCTPKSGPSIYNYRPVTIKLNKVKLKLEA